MSHTQYYLYLWLVALIVGVSCYNVGYDFASKDYARPTEYRCHEEVVYKWTGSYWYKLDQSCKTDKQIQGTI